MTNDEIRVAISPETDEHSSKSNSFTSLGSTSKSQASSSSRSSTTTSNPTSIPFVFWDLGLLNQWQQFIACSVGVFLCFLIYGYCQELIFTLDVIKSHGWFITFLQFCFYTVFSSLERQCRKQTSSRRIPLKSYAVLAFLTLGTIGCSNSSLEYLNYPTQVVFKCCKLLPVLVGAVIIQGKQQSVVDFVAAVLMAAGLAFFTLADSKVAPHFHPYGVFLISLALTCDAIIGNVQEKWMKAYDASTSEVVLYSYSIGAVYLGFYEIITLEMATGLGLCFEYPVQVIGYGAVFSLSGYVGVQLVLILVRTCGAFVAVTVTTARKAVTIVLSFLIFTKPFTFQYVWAGLLVLFGIYLNVWSKNQTRYSFPIITLPKCKIFQSKSKKKKDGRLSNV